MDRAYLDFERLYLMHQIGAFFVTRAKKNLRAHRVYSARKDGEGGVLADQTIALDGPASRRRYPAHLRRIRYRDPASGKTLVFLTNRTDLEALTICDLYKSRWQVELFFKWIKQHLRIKRFFGTSENAVKSQLWVAVSVYVLVATIRKQLESRPPSTRYSRSCRSCRLNKSRCMKSLQNLNPGLQKAAARSIASVRPVTQHRLPLRTPVGRASSPTRRLPRPSSQPARRNWIAPGGPTARSGCCSRGAALSERLGNRDQSSSLNGCLSLCTPFYPSQGPYNPVPFYTNLQFLRDLPAVKVL